MRWINSIIKIQYVFNCMQRLSNQQRQVLLRMRRSNNTAEQLHSFYQSQGQELHASRVINYQRIAYYLYQNERKAIEQYYRNKFQQEKDEQQKAFYEKLCAFLKTFHLQNVNNYQYSKEEIAEKDRLFYEKQINQEQGQIQRIKEMQAKHSNTILQKLSTIWKLVCIGFKSQVTSQEYEKNKNVKQI